MVAEAPNPDAAPGAGTIRLLEGDALDPLVQPQCSLSVQLRRASGSIVGRSSELAAIGQVLRDAQDHLAAVTLEGEPGIGKTRLLVTTAELARAAGFTVVAITADEEIRGPFLVARSLFANGAIRETAAGTRAELSVRRVAEALAGRDEPGLESLTPEAKVLRAFDLAGVALVELARLKPLALMLDDVQWADDDTLRLLRYALRAVAEDPVFLFMTFRSDEFAAAPEAVNFVADMERMGLVRRLRPSRFSAAETGLLLANVLGGKVEGQSAAAMHVQSEGVPFIVEELARAHREAGTLQQVDGEWRLGRNAARLVPSAVRTLISRRATSLPRATLAILGEAGVLGRSFSVRDILAVRAGGGAAAGVTGAAMGGTGAGAGAGPGPGGAAPSDDAEVAAVLAPAVQAGLLLQHPEGDAADYTFTHEQVREFAVAQLSNARRREVHRAVVDLLLGDGGEAPPEGLQMLAQHALAAGDTKRAARFSIDAASAALRSNAPEEALRLVDAALPVVSAPSDRRALLTTRDDAHAALRRSTDRLDGLAELGALAEALGDRGLELDVQLRRAAALRAGHDEDAAAELARRVRDRAAEAGDRESELRANLELGQALTRTAIGESFGVSSHDIDLDAADQAFRRAAELAEALGDDRSLAAALRELGTFGVSRARDWFVTAVRSGAALDISRRALAGQPIDEIVVTLPIAGQVKETNRLFERALELYDRLGDRTGVMSTVIAMAYGNYAPIIHLASSARHLEEIRRVTSRMTELVTESERARQELQMLFGVHVFARAKVVPDLALSRGEEAYRAAKLGGDQGIEFAAAGGVAMTYLDLGDVDAAERWIGNAAQLAGSAPTQRRVRQLELWRGRIRACAGDAAGARRHLEQAVALAARGGAAARCEAYATLALVTARLASRSNNPDLLEVAVEAAEQAKTLAAALPGHAPWGAQADAALAEAALLRGDVGAAAAAAGAALQAIETSMTEDAELETVLSAARGIFAAAPEEAQAGVRGWLKHTLSRVAQATVDDQVRVRWLKGPLGRELVELAGGLDAPSERRSAGATTDEVTALDERDRRIVHLLTEGRTNHEMAEALGLSEVDVAQHLARVLARLGASNRAEATSLAFRGLTPPKGLVAAAGSHVHAGP